MKSAFFPAAGTDGSQHAPCQSAAEGAATGPMHTFPSSRLFLWDRTPQGASIILNPQVILCIHSSGCFLTSKTIECQTMPLISQSR